jgi:hypothetical protein
MACAIYPGGFLIRPGRSDFLSEESCTKNSLEFAGAATARIGDHLHHRGHSPSLTSHLRCWSRIGLFMSSSQTVVRPQLEEP